jgi:hypothetical protein
VPERITRLALGDFDAPAAGVRRRADPPDAAVRDGRRSADGAAGTLVLGRPVVPGFSAVGVTWAAEFPHTESTHAEFPHTESTHAESPHAESPHAESAHARVAVVAVRVHQGGAWTSWRTAAPAEPGRGDGERRAGSTAAPRDGAELMWWGPASGVEVAVTAPAGRGPRNIAVDLIDPGERPGDAAADATPPAGAGAPDPGGPGVPDLGPGVRDLDPGGPGVGASPYLRPRVRMPAVVRRAGWGANERKMRWRPEYVAELRAGTVHHTATTNAYRRGEVPRILRSIYHFHAVSRGWGDIGYNVLVDRFGRLWEGRAGGLSRPVVGAHSGGYNSYTTGVAFIGDHRARAVPAAAREAAARFLAWKFSLSPAFDPRGRTRLTGGGSTSRYPPGTTITVFRVHGHRRTNATTCPGARGMAVLPGLRRRTLALLGVWARPARLRTRLTVWRPASNAWYVHGVSGPVLLGRAGDVPVTADFDGDGTPDLATWSSATKVWLIRYSAYGRVGGITLGGAGHVPVPADTDGDGRAEPMTWDPATGMWHRRGVAAVRWGSEPGDVPVPADYSGDGRADLAVWRPGTGTWHIRGVGVITFGNAWHVPVPYDYDGDGAVEPVTWSPGSHRFYYPDRPFREFGQVGDVPLPGQYDGDAPTELAVWRVVNGTGQWVVEGIGTYAVGTQGDQPIPAG